MSSPKQILELSETEGFIGFGSSLSVVHHGFPQDLKNASDIHELQMQLEQKDQEIAELHKKVRELDNKNNDLVIKLKAKDKEVNKLKERIHKLEDEKKVLQEELASVKNELKINKNEVADLNKSRDSQEEKSNEIEEDLAKIKFTLESVEEDLKSTKKENENLKKQVKEVRNSSRYVAEAPLRLPVQADDQSKALSCIEELFCQILTAMYRLVLPEFFTPIIRYTLVAIENDAKKLPHTEEEKQQAAERLERLKKELQWSDDFDEILESLPLHSRTLDTHRPGLDEKLLRKATEDLEKQGILKGWLSLDRINSLIDLWKRLQCKQ